MIETIKGGCQEKINDTLLAYRLEDGPLINQYSVSQPSNLLDDAPGMFYGAVHPQSSSKAFFVPSQHPHIGIYNCSDNTYTDGPLHSAGSQAFRTGIDLENNKILLCPYNSSYIGLYNYALNTYTRGPSVTGFTKFNANYGRFTNCIKVNNKVYLIPGSSNYIGIYDISNNTLSQGPAVMHNSYSINAFSGSAQISTTEILLVPFSGIYLYILNTETNTLTQHISSNSSINIMSGCVATKYKVYIYQNDNFFSIYDIGTKSLQKFPADTAYGFSDKYSAAILAGNKIILVPKRISRPGEIDLKTNTFAKGNYGTIIFENSTYKNFYGGGCLYGSNVIMAPYHATNIGIYKPTNVSNIFG